MGNLTPNTHGHNFIKFHCVTKQLVSKCQAQVNHYLPYPSWPPKHNFNQPTHIEQHSETFTLS